MDAAIRTRGLVKRFGDLVAVAGIDLEVHAGECFGLLGPNGAGKTTTVEILEGLAAPTAGEVEVLGRSWARDAGELRRRIGVALQETHLPERLTVEETLALFRSFFAAGPAVDAVIDLVQLGEKRKAWTMRLSGGQRQRLAVACALVGDPELLFLDEPTTGLDPQSRRSLWELIEGFRARGRTTLLTTHYMEEAERLCDRVAVVDHGRIIAAGSPAELIAGLPAPHLVELATDPPLPAEALAAIPSARACHPTAGEGGGLALSVGEPRLAIPAIVETLAARGVRLTALAVRRATLEDVFLSLTGRALREP
jgi:ABC-2 type transport system ATP-binding protein